MNRKWLINKLICCAIMVVLIFGVVVGNVIAYDWETQLNLYLTQDIVDEQAAKTASKAGQKMASQLMTEGAVLLENKDSVLPLSTTDNNKVNVFGYTSVDWSYGALGSSSSGMITPEPTAGGVEKLVDFIKALKKFGISTNTEIQNFYKNWKEPLFGIKDPWSAPGNIALTLCDPNMSEYPSSLLQNAKEYSSTAFVVLSRTGAEGSDSKATQVKRGPGQSEDTTRRYLQISTEEEGLLKYVGANYENVIVILNSPNVVESEFMNTIPGLDALVYVGTTGTQSASAIPALLYGEQTFSGKTVDTYAYEFDATYPASYSKWFQSDSYSTGSYGVDYVEGIYVGYKWFETADKEGVWNGYTSSQAPDKTGYQAVVQYPFGHGLSYTTFDWTVKKVTKTQEQITAKTKISIEVEVKNTGSKYSGMDVVQVYVTVPYTKGGIEKSYVSLVGYAKTSLLAPQTAQTVTVEIDCADFMSYDCYDKNENGFTGWELEAGDYQLKLMENSHDIKEVIFESDGHNKEGVITFNVPQTITYRNSLITNNEVNNLFTGDQAVDGFSLDGIENGYNANIPFMTRADFATGYQIPERTTDVSKRALSDGAKEAVAYSNAEGTAWDNATVDVFGKPTYNQIVAEESSKTVKWGQEYAGEAIFANGEVTGFGLQLGADYNDSRWEAILNRVTFQEAYNLIDKSPSGNKAIPSIGKPRIQCFDSIVQIKGFSGLTAPRGTGNPTTVIMAQTWNKDLMYKFALSYAEEMKVLGVWGVFGPGVNLHRSNNTGRNYEYFSEDTFITTECARYIIRGIQDKGCGVELKHFALNEMEKGRYGVGTWLTEQALRETYLKPFQVVVEQENCSAIMSSYNRIGAKWTGGSQALIQGVLRNEWDFNGYVDTDWTVGDLGSPDEQLRAGGDIGMSENLGRFGLTYNEATSSQRLQYAMRNAVHHNLYSVLSTKYQASLYIKSSDEKQTSSLVIKGWEWWKTALTAFDITVGFGIVFWLAFLFIPNVKAGKNSFDSQVGDNK